MTANTFGERFRVTTFGESHGGAVGCVIDGCPSQIKIDLALIQTFLDRRRPGPSLLTSPRNEPDQVACLSGLTSEGLTLGTPITLLVYNQDAKPSDYSELSHIYRPSHADFTTEAKFGIRAESGGGRASARETIGRVAAGALAEQVISHLHPKLEVIAYVEKVKNLKINGVDFNYLSRKQIEQNSLRCPDSKSAEKMTELIKTVALSGDSVGGVISCVVKNPPPGLGEPVFDKLEADLAKGMLSLPATKGFEIGSGFAGSELLGSEHNDEFYPDPTNGQIKTKTNHSGGVQGGITNGENIYFRVAFKPVASIFKPQATVNNKGEAVTMQIKKGRHDPCVLPRAVPMVEAMTLLVLLDHVLRGALSPRVV